MTSSYNEEHLARYHTSFPTKKVCEKLRWCVSCELCFYWSPSDFMFESPNGKCSLPNIMPRYSHRHECATRMQRERIYLKIHVHSYSSGKTFLVVPGRLHWDPLWDRGLLRYGICEMGLKCYYHIHVFMNRQSVLNPCFVMFSLIFKRIKYEASVRALHFSLRSTLGFDQQDFMFESLNGKCSLPNIMPRYSHRHQCATRMQCERKHFEIHVHSYSSGKTFLVVPGRLYWFVQSSYCFW